MRKDQTRHKRTPPSERLCCKKSRGNTRGVKPHFLFSLVLQRHLNRLSRRGDGNIGSLQDLQHASPPPVLAPASVATLYRMPGSKAFRQRAPERSCLYDPQDPLHNPSMIAGWTACERLRRQEWTQALPTLRRQFLYTQQGERLCYSG